MKNILLYIFALGLSFCSCSTQNKDETIEKWKLEIVETEKDFAELASLKGISTAFLAYAADDAVLNRDNVVIVGKKEIETHFVNQTPNPTSSLTWKPDFVDVSTSGDLGYTYGKYTYSYEDENGLKKENRGVFHTVWKRQEDGAWKFVWD